MVAWLGIFVATAQSVETRRVVSREQPRLLGSLPELRALAAARTNEFERVRAVARDASADDYSWLISAGLVAAVDRDGELAGRVQARAMQYVQGPIRQGDVPFATDLTLGGLAYDLCYQAWSEADRRKFHEYLNRTAEANVQSETHVFHNGWYGYKNWGIGVAAYACYHEKPQAKPEASPG